MPARPRTRPRKTASTSRSSATSSAPSSAVSVARARSGEPSADGREDPKRPAEGAEATAAAEEEEEEEKETLDLFTTLARTGLFLDALQRECLGEHGLAFTEYSVLRLLQRAPGRQLSPSQLAERIVCTTGAMTKLVDRLQRAGHVEREPDPADRRGVLVTITRAGGRIANRAAAAYDEGRERVLGRLDRREAGRIHKSLERLLNALESDRLPLVRTAGRPRA